MIIRNRLFSFVLLIISFNAYIECADTRNDVESKILKDLYTEKFKNNSNLLVKFEFMKKKCFKATGSDKAYKALLEGLKKTNLYDIMDVSKFSSGNLSKPAILLMGKFFFKQFCRKQDIINGYRDNITRLIKPCLEPEEFTGLQILETVSYNLFNYLCDNDGALIDSLFTEKSLNCVYERKDDLTQCLDNTIHKYLPSKEKDKLPEEWPKFMIGNTLCNIFNSLQGCIVPSLKKCPEQTLANLVESIFKSAREACTNTKKNG